MICLKKSKVKERYNQSDLGHGRNAVCTYSHFFYNWFAPLEEKELEEKLRPSRNQERFGEKREGHFSEESETESETASEWGRRLAGGK